MDWLEDKLDQFIDSLTKSNESERLLNSIADSNGGESLACAQEYIKQENPRNRVKRLFFKDPNTSEKYIEGIVCGHLCMLTACIAGSLAFSLSAPIARSNFLRANAVTVYHSRFLAQRQANDAYMLGGVKKMIKWTIITYIGAAPFIYLSQALELYRYKTSIVNYVVSGSIVAGASRVLLGPRGMFAGALIGAYGGTVIGFITTTAMKKYDLTFEERYEAEIKQKIDENRYLKSHGEKVAERLKKESSGKSSESETLHGS